jgi:hypothetical protein
MSGSPARFIRRRLFKLSKRIILLATSQIGSGRITSAGQRVAVQAVAVALGVLHLSPIFLNFAKLASSEEINESQEVTFVTKVTQFAQRSRSLRRLDALYSLEELCLMMGWYQIVWKMQGAQLAVLSRRDGWDQLTIDIYERTLLNLKMCRFNQAELLYRSIPDKDKASPTGLARTIPLPVAVAKSSDLQPISGDWEPLTKNMRVVIVGPAPDSQTASLAKIDTADTIYFWVTSLSHSALNAELPATFGIDPKRSLLVLNGENARAIAAGRHAHGLDRYQGVVLKGPTSRFPMARPYVMSALSGFSLLGTPNLVQALTTQLLLQSPREIFVSGVNFFSTKIQYREGSDLFLPTGKLKSSDGMHDKVTIRHMYLAHHNLLENWSMMKYLVGLGTINGTSEFIESLDQDPDRYMESLQEL